MSDIHPTAVIASGAELGTDLVIGPYCIIGPQVRLGDGCVLKSHVNVDGFTVLGEACTLWPFSSIGTQTQDLKYAGGTPGVVIGDRNTFREYATVNAATADGDLTRVGNDCHIMAYSHVAHDCRLEDGVIMANAATLAGHVLVEEQAIIGGLCGVHQFVRVGKQSIIGGCSKVVKDVPPYMTADGNPLDVRGLNSIGLKRKGVDPTVYKQLKQAYRIIYRQGKSTSQAIEAMEAELESIPEVAYLVEFLRNSERGIH